MKSDVWVKITESAFRDAKFEDITFIIQILSWQPNNSIEKAYFFIDSYDFESMDNFQKTSKIQQDLIEENTKNAFTNGKNNKPKYTITNKQNTQNNELSIEEAIRFFLTPVIIVLENSLNDSYFIRAMFKHFGEQRNGKNILLEFLRNDWIQFVNAGGWTNIKNFIEGRKQALQNLYRIPLFLRAFVLIDSDKKSADDEVSQTKINLKKDMEAKGVKVHILKKRAMENYMPEDIVKNLEVLVRRKNDKSFDGWLNSQSPRDWINNYTHNLTEGEKDYSDYQAGLNFPNYKTEFPKFFQCNDYVTRDSLLSRAGGTEEDNEFLEIINKIYELL